MEERRAARKGEVITVAPGQGHQIPGPEGVTLLATAEQTGGTIGVLEVTSSPGFAAPPHVHRSADELFYVLAGEFEFAVGDRVFRGKPGAFVFIPRGTAHSPRVVSEGSGRALSAFVPGGQEHAFEEFAALAQAGVDPAGPAFQAVARKYDSEFLPPAG